MYDIRSFFEYLLIYLLTSLDVDNGGSGVFRVFLKVTRSVRKVLRFNV